MPRPDGGLSRISGHLTAPTALSRRKRSGKTPSNVRVTSAYEDYVGSGKYSFRSRLPPVGHHAVVKVTWEMVTIPENEIASIGIEFLVLDIQGRIASDHQFIVQ